MKWVYSQGTGKLTHPDGGEFATGYSGAGDGKNNCAMQHVKNVGPIPQGLWHIGSVYDSKKVGPYAIRLEPDATTHTFGRSAFLIHGDNRTHTASEGCIILSRRVRNAIIDSGVKLLQVIPILLAFVTTSAQSNTCTTAVPYVDNDCILFQPPRASIERCYTFTAATDSVDFTFTAFVPQGTCQDAVTGYRLHGAGCVLLAQNATGNFGDLIPQQSYVVCYTTSCPTTGVVNFLCVAEDAALPVSLIYLTATSDEECVRLLWATGFEQDCLGYQVDRSADASTWINIGFVAGALHSMQRLDYSFTDRQPLQGVSFYRLTQHDVGGTLERFDVIAVHHHRGKPLNVLRGFNILGQRTP